MKRDANATGTSAARDVGAGQRGYALVALLALMTVLMIAMMAAAPSLQQQSRRERELEAIARGEEVADAIRTYIRLRRGQPPTSMEELLGGVTPLGTTKKVYVLRASAARDPLSKSGEWRTVKVNDPAFVNFVKQLTVYANGRTPPATNDPALAPLAQQLPRPGGILDLGESEEAPCDEDASASSNGPFIGVASRNRCASIVTYYGIERHDRWVFTPFYR